MILEVIYTAILVVIVIVAFVAYFKFIKQSDHPVSNKRMKDLSRRPGDSHAWSHRSPCVIHEQMRGCIGTLCM